MNMIATVDAMLWKKILESFYCLKIFADDKKAANLIENGFESMRHFRTKTFESEQCYNR